MNTEISGDLLQRHPVLTVTGNPDHIVTELLRVRLGHVNILPGPPSGKPDRCHLSVQQPLPHMKVRLLALRVTATILLAAAARSVGARERVDGGGGLEVERSHEFSFEDIGAFDPAL
ncbi:hypothetical protein [Nocardia wallacei]|uniref:Uncharacterized protein n=1 Tax=Nocardia wallacei TaxID=480035 RepID=A0A7G1KNZ3_9NOCA|nr:hypothetical protein [Nocardia wallacei]BCK56256.1 hypothetical protein NWFMUON74_40280 [Nocardia wallacei]